MSDKTRRNSALRQSSLNEINTLKQLALDAQKDKSLFIKFKVRYTSVEDIKDEFFKYHNALLGALATDKDYNLVEEDAIKVAFLESYYDVRSIYTSLFHQDPFNTTVKPQSDAPDHSDTAHVKLPKIQLNKFSGDIRDFPSFKDMFDALVHSNNSIPPVEKFNYLRSSLEGTPLDLIKRLNASSDNYQIAYETLVKRYTNPRAQARAHWLEIENFPSLKSENPTQLRKLLDTFAINLESLKTMNVAVHCDFILTHMLLSRLDPDTSRAFEREHGSTAIPAYATVFQFLEEYCNGLISLNSTVYARNSPSKATPLNDNRKRNSFMAQTKSRSPKCVICQSDHPTYNCYKYLEKSPRERHLLCRTHHLCFSCLSSFHDLKNCKSSSSCRKCNSKTHHTTLHFDREGNTVDATASTSETPRGGRGLSPTRMVMCARNFPVSSRPQVLLCTALVEIQTGKGHFKQFRAVLDSGSEISIISQKCFSALNLRSSSCNTVINGIGNQTQLENLGNVEIFVKPVGLSDPTFIINAAILPKICEKLPSRRLPPQSWNYLDNLKLADRKYYHPGDIDVLLGADVFSRILMGEHIQGQNGGPDALNTVFGYVLMGKIYNNTVSSRSVHSLICETHCLNDLNDSMNKFFDLESVPIFDVGSGTDICEDIFINNFYRTHEGRYVVPLPFKETFPLFPNSRDLAVQRFMSLERRLLRSPQLYEEYCSVIREYLTLSHMEIVEPAETMNSFYLPHHAVLRPDKSSTKLRVVFNASAKISNNSMTLNDFLHVGPKLQTDISSILIRFRLNKICFTADIKQMYRQILVAPEFRDYQRLIFRFSSSDKLMDLRINTVTFGLNCAPYLALRTLRQLAIDEKDSFPLASTILVEDTYIDDICSGGDSLHEAKNLRDELIALLAKGGFELRKWASNEPRLLEDLAEDSISFNPMPFELQQNASIKILGLHWDSISDCFFYNVNPIDRPITKRNLLSELARIFDPSGFLAPVTFLCKYLIQKLWLLGLDWDETPDQEISRIWLKFKEELRLLSSVKIPRYFDFDADNVIELHAFTDASERGYGTAVYLRVMKADKINTFLLCAKSKVASCSKKISIARMELCGAVLLTKVVCWVQSVLKNKIQIRSLHAYTDSQIVLAWLNANPNRWQTFVANRVAYIQENVDCSCWSYVKSQHNPADAASRGLYPSELLNCEIWFRGPAFLQEASWESVGVDLQTSEEERKNVLFAIRESNILDDLMNNISSFSRLQHIILIISRFIFNCRNPLRKRVGFFTSFELNNALKILIKRTQSVAFASEISDNKFSKPLRKLNIFFDEDNIIRVGGRLTYSDLSYDRKHPILLPRKGRLVQLLIEFYHIKNMHAGRQTTQFLISQKFWILAARRAIRSVLSTCMKCWKTNPVPWQPKMGNLPLPRISQVKPFLHSGVDYGGPFSIYMNRYRGAKTCKAYICLFVCMATKALHLELASDLSTDAFMACLRRFVSRRGRCAHLYSDQGTNFVGSRKEIRNMLESVAGADNIEHHFLPGNAPHLGGLWEAGIKSVKTHLKRVIGEQILTYEEFYTVLVQIEAVLNSRPLTPMSSDVNDLSVLTAGHFLTLEPLHAIPDQDVTDVPISRLKRWQLIQRLQQDFWQRWKREYLHTLQQRSKWLNDTDAPIIGTLVLIKNDNAPPLKWEMGRILQVHPGIDKIVRVATVKVQRGTITRPLVKLCPLPVEA